MERRYYLAMAHYVWEYIQSDELFLMKLADGRTVGYSREFDLATCDIARACVCGKVEEYRPEEHNQCKWFELLDQDKSSWRPATLEEIAALNLSDCVIGSKKDMESDSILALS